MLSVIDEKHGVFDVVFPLKLPQKCCVNAVVVVVDSRTYGKSFVSELTAATAETVGHYSHHRLVKRDVTRTGIVGWL